MSYSPTPDDTQPRRPDAEARPGRFDPSVAYSPRYSSGGSGYLEPPPAPRRANGCLMLLILAAMGAASLVIVALAGLAGWTSGQRQAAVFATATQNAAIQEQWSRIPADIAAGNIVLLEARIRFLATLTPGVPGVPELWLTATGLASGSATSTPTPTAPPPTAAATDTAPISAPTAGAPLMPTPTPGLALDLAALLTEAQTQIAGSQWADAIDTLDVIIAVDATYQAALVRSLMVQALGSYALELYNGGQLAAGNNAVTRMEQFGTVPGNLSYERIAAGLMLNARSAIGVGYPQAIQALRAVIDLGAGGRYYQEATTLLYEQYVAYGDAFSFENNWCSAAQQYENALRIFSSGAATAKFSSADTLCRTPPTFDPLAPLPNSTLPADFVPLGQ